MWSTSRVVARQLAPAAKQLRRASTSTPQAAAINTEKSIKRPISRGISPYFRQERALSASVNDQSIDTFEEDSGPGETLVVVGSGWAGYQFLRKLDKSKYKKVICLSGSTTFVTTPLLPSAASGALNFRDIIEPLQSGKDYNYYHAWAQAIDFKNQVIKAVPASKPAMRGRDPMVQEQQRDARIEIMPVKEIDIKYDKLVIATGCYNQTFGTPGVREHAFFLKDIESAAAIRYQVYDLMDAANWPGLSDQQVQALLTWVIVGGGPTGSELAAELHDLAKSKEFNRIYPRHAPKIKIKLMDAAPQILSTFDKTLSSYAIKKFRREGIEVLTSRKIIRVEEFSIVTEQDGEVPTGLVVWSTGNKASPLNEAIKGLKKDKRNSLLTNDQFQVLVDPLQETSVEQQQPQQQEQERGGRVLENVWAIGDCSQIEGQPLPATAQVANQEGVHLANLLSGRTSADPKSKIFNYVHKGSMTNIGGGQGLIQSPLGDLRGRIAWMLWRGFYWISSLSFRNKWTLMVRWTQNAFLGRDTSRM